MISSLIASHHPCGKRPSGTNHLAGERHRTRAAAMTVLAAGRYQLPIGINETFKLPLTAAGRRMLKSGSWKHPLYVQVVITLTNGTTTITERVTIR